MSTDNTADFDAPSDSPSFDNSDNVMSPMPSDARLPMPANLKKTNAESKSEPENPQPDSASARSIDPHLVRETKVQIRNLVNEINYLVQSEISRDEFCDGFLSRVVSALGSNAGAIWFIEENQITLHHQVAMNNSGLSDDLDNRTQHDLLLRQHLKSPEPKVVPERSGRVEKGEPGNPTEHLLILGSIKVANETVAIVEIFQRSGGGPATQRGYLRFLAQMCDLASNFFTKNDLKNFGEQQGLWDRLEKFIRVTHRGLDYKETLYTIANEGRRIVECDRLSVATIKGRHCQISVVSGLDSFDRRSEDIKNLTALVSVASKAQEPIWFEGDFSNLPPQIEKKLHQYVDKSHTKSLGIFPLYETQTQQDIDRKKPKTLIGAIVSERLSDTEFSNSMRNRVEVIAGHASDAMTNSLQHDRIFMRPVWQGIGKLKADFNTGMPTWLLVISFIGVAIFVACVTPYDFDLASEGKLTPQIQHSVFAPNDGTLSELYIPNDREKIVDRNDLLALIDNDELNVEIQNLQGKFEENKERIKKIQRILNRDADELSFQDQQIYEGEEAELTETQNSIRRLLSLKLQQRGELSIFSPARGRIVNWQIKENLLRRPVKAGDNIMTVIDPDGPWEVELEMPEKRMGHLLDARKKSNKPLHVTFVLASHPNKEFNGQIIEIDRKTEVHSDQGNAVLVRVQFDRGKLSPEMLREGTRVSARVQCGKKSLSFVMFHEAIETIQKKILLWF